MVFQRKKKTKPKQTTKKDTVKVSEGEVKVYKKEVKKPERYDSVLETAEEVVKLIPKVCTTEYACTNAYTILQNALKKLRLANY